MARSQNGWTAGQRSLMQWFVIPGTNVELLLRKDYAGPLLIAFAIAFNKYVERCVDPGCWSYANRAIRGSKVTSNHASGTAIDLNAPRHPLGRRGTFNAAQRAQIRRLLNLTEGAIRWGGDYSGRADEMHFELNTTDVAKILRAMERLKSA